MLGFVCVCDIGFEMNVLEECLIIIVISLSDVGLDVF